jgi:orotidine-5'-phosphate decarboxylase
MKQLASNSFSNDIPIIVALDYANTIDVMNFVAKVDPSLCKLKVGKELFTACGPQLVEKLIISGFSVFLDLKFHDIPNTVYKACKAATNLGVWMLNVHASGGEEMLAASRQAVDETNSNAKLIAVTVLTSMAENQLPNIGINDSLQKQVLRLAKLSYKNKLDGVVCSAQESLLVKNSTSSDFLTVTPGIRLTTNKTDDQTRILTPAMAIAAHADYLVIGRPITSSSNPAQTLHDILASLV